MTCPVTRMRVVDNRRDIAPQNCDIPKEVVRRSLLVSIPMHSEARMAAEEKIARHH